MILLGKAFMKLSHVLNICRRSIWAEYTESLKNNCGVSRTDI
jgi:hypothetical protein